MEALLVHLNSMGKKLSKIVFFDIQNANLNYFMTQWKNER